MKQMLLSCSALAVLSLAACGPADAPADSNSGAEVAATETAAAPVYGTFGFDVDGMDSSVHAGDDFNQFANGTWLTETEIPGEFSRYGTFSILALEAEEQVQAIIDDAAAEGVKLRAPTASWWAICTPPG
jgi:putative endopeptidase